MKKLIIILFILVVLFGETVFAGDPECLMMYGNQELLVVGEIIDINQDFFTLEVSHKFQGECNDIIKVKPFEKYWIISNEPNAGDYCVISLNSIESMYVIEQGVYKTDTVDYKTLKTIKRKDGEQEDILTTIDWFVNSNGEYKHFFSTSSKTYLRKENGEEIQIYPKIEEEKEESDFSSKDNKELVNSSESSDKMDITKEVESKTIQSKNFAISFGIILVLGGIFVILKKTISNYSKHT